MQCICECIDHQLSHKFGSSVSLERSAQVHQVGVNLAWEKAVGVWRTDSSKGLFIRRIRSIDRFYSAFHIRGSHHMSIMSDMAMKLHQLSDISADFLLNCTRQVMLALCAAQNLSLLQASSCELWIWVPRRRTFEALWRSQDVKLQTDVVPVSWQTSTNSIRTVAKYCWYRFVYPLYEYTLHSLSVSFRFSIGLDDRLKN